MGAIKSPSRRQSEQQTFIEMNNTLVMMQSKMPFQMIGQVNTLKVIHSLMQVFKKYIHQAKQ